MKNRTENWIIVSIFTLISVSGAFGDEKKMTTEMRQKMADAHQKMAECLRSDKPVDECKKDLMKSCSDTMGKECPMMSGMHHHMKGDMEKGKMGGDAVKPSPTKS